MKISDIKVYLCKEWRTFLFVVVETDEGIYGVGESGLTSREKAVAGAIEHLTPILIGQDPFRTEHLWQMMWRGGFYPAGLILSAAISAIDIALWDIKGKALGVPLYQLFGGLCRDKVLTYNHLHSATTESVLEGCQKAVADGWKCVRWEPAYRPDHVIEPRESIREALKQWEAIRTTIGDDIELCFDVHTKLTLPDAIRFCREVEQFRPFFIEDPIRSENKNSYRHLRQQTAVPIAAGEQFDSKWQYRQLIEEDLIDYARIDLCIGGGFTESRKIAGWCETHYIDIAVHNPVGPVSSVACLHFNVSLPNFGVMELPKRPHETMPELLSGQPEWKDGYLYPSDRPGLGIEFHPEALAKYPFEMTELPHLRRQDGSFTNW